LDKHIEPVSNVFLGFISFAHQVEEDSKVAHNHGQEYQKGLNSRSNTQD
tara:strand:+ start:207 stop:353 length:147 start_codon:yes stop_codon:yes gene_type:complete